MKEMYEKAELEAIYLDLADIISTSVDPDDLHGNDDNNGTPGELP